MTAHGVNNGNSSHTDGQIWATTPTTADLLEDLHPRLHQED